MVTKRNKSNRTGSSQPPSASTAYGASSSSSPPYSGTPEAPPATSHSLYMSKEPQYQVPTAFRNPVEYFKNLWELYEATFAISMLETVSLSTALSKAQANQDNDSQVLQWESVLLRRLG